MPFTREQEEKIKTALERTKGDCPACGNNSWTLGKGLTVFQIGSPKATEALPDDQGKDLQEAAKTLSVAGAKKGGRARAQALSAERRSELARKAVEARWAKRKGARLVNPLPVAAYRGVLSIMDDVEIPCYVLDDGTRVIGRTSATEMLTGIKGGGALEKYLDVDGYKPFVDSKLILERMKAFSLPEVEGLGKEVKGLPADLLIDICKGLVAALEASNRDDPGVKLTARQQQIAIKAGMFVAACAKVGIEALIDEATGAQYDRARDALEVKLRAYLEQEMRQWEKTFPDELWLEFGRLTGWKGSVTKRPKYWGHLVMELVYEGLDKDVADWLKKNAPAPRHGQNYHQWMSGQYGLKKLIEHIWMVIGVAKTCTNIVELKRKMAEMNGKVPVQYTLYLPAPKA